MEIKKGMKFRCIKDVNTISGEKVYIKNNIYTLVKYGYITDERGECNKWIDNNGDLIDGFYNHFKQSIESSVKNDFKDGKLRWDLLPLELIEELVKVYDYGAKKYYPESWKEIPDGYQRLKAASLRHLVAFEKGEENDPESGLPHLIQARWNLLTCYYYAKLKEKEE